MNPARHMIRVLVLSVLVPLSALVPTLATPAAAQRPDSIFGDSVIAMAPLRVEVLRTAMEGARTPYAVSGLGPRELGPSRPGAFLSDAITALPGLQIQNRYNFAVGERIAVRGFGARAQFGVRGLQVFLDGVPATLPDGQTTLDHVNSAVLESVELLRGPMAALYGNGAGGVLLLRSMRPREGRRILLTGQGGSHGFLQLSGAAEVARGATASRIQLTRMSYGGFRGDPTGDGTYGEAERWTTTASHRTPLGGGSLTVVAAGVELDAENPGSLPADRLDDPDRPAWGFNVIQGTGKELRQLQVGANWDRPLFADDGNVTATLWGLTRDVTNPIPTAIIDLGRTALGGRLGLGRTVGAFRWDAGADLEVMRDDRRNYGNEGNAQEGALTLAQDETVTGVGVFTALSWTRGPGNLHAALRYDRVHFEVDDELILADGLDESGSRTLDAWSPSLGGQLRLGAVSLFSSVSSFLQTPTTTELANRPDGAGGFNPELEPTTGWSAEAGVRGTLLQRVGWELLAFHTELNDELIPFEVPSDPGRTFFRNAGESRYRGVEAALRFALPMEVTGRMAYTRVDARFQGGEFHDNRIPGRAPNLLEGLVEKRLRDGFVTLNVTWSDDVPVNDGNTAEAEGYWLVGLRGGLDGVMVGTTRLSPWVALQNLFDTEHVSSVAVNAFGSRYFEPGPGRTVQVGVRAELDWR